MGRDRSDDEAASWLARLNQPLVAQQDLAAFRRWRESPRNDAAFRRVQQIWRDVDQLRGHGGLQDALVAARSVRRRRAPFVPATAAVLAGVSLLIVVGYLLRTPGEVFSTAIGERSSVRLADGSLLQLDTDSRVVVRLAPGRRQVVLDRGQALFNVAHDASRPFTVRAGTLSVLATGTRFDVRRDGPSGPSVVLLEGRVRVQRNVSQATPVDLAPGQSFAAAHARPETPADLDSSISWTTGQLTFRDAPLDWVVHEANRYNRRRIVLDSVGGMNQLRVSGVFTAGDAPSLARALSELHGLRTTSEPDGSLRLSPSPTKPPPPASAES